MIFARYIGPKAPNWTEGKVYFAMAGFEDQTTVDIGTLRLEDDTGTWQQIQSDSGQFVFPDFVYAAIVKPIGSLEHGQVVRVLDFSDGFFSVENHGYLKENFCEVLDRTNVALGNKVRDPSDGIWHRISRIDADLNLGWWEEDRALISSFGFIFPVSGGSVLAEPWLKCVKGVDGELTEGQVYSPESEKDGLVVVVNDAGKPTSYMRERFTEEP
jgi:hypothetical protein